MGHFACCFHVGAIVTDGKQLSHVASTSTRIVYLLPNRTLRRFTCSTTARYTIPGYTVINKKLCVLWIWTAVVTQNAVDYSYRFVTMNMR